MSPSPTWFASVATNAFWLGQLHYDKSNYAATEPLFKKYHSYSETMYSLAPNDFNSIMEL